jgi:Mn2+/Fe2+ NRAMP family transporter
MTGARQDNRLETPRGFNRVRWLGPGLLWMVAAAGSGELLFTPIVAARHGYALFWALLAAVSLKWFINREIGRYSVCTGETILQGFRRVGNWAVWVIVVPQPGSPRQRSQA